MFGFLVRKKQDDVRTLFAGYVNRSIAQRVCDTRRNTSRTAFCDVVWLIPLAAASREPQFPQAVPVVTKDISQEGLAIIHTGPVTEELVLIGLPGEVSMRFVVCRVEHSTPLGYSFHHVGMTPVQVIDLSPVEEHEFRRRQRQFDEDLSTAETV